MRSPILAIIAATAAFGITAVSPAKAEGGFKKRMAVMPLQLPDHRWGPLGSEISDMLVTRLSDKGMLVVERMQLSKIMDEQGLGKEAGVMDPKTVAKLGKLAGVQVMIVGSISEFGEKRTGRGINIGGIPLGDNKTEARVRLDVRAVDVATGIILTSASGEGTEATKGQSIDISRLLGTTAQFDTHSSEWTDSRLGKASRKAADATAEALVKKLESGSGAAAEVANAESSLSVEIGGLTKFTQARSLVEALGRVKGVKSAKSLEFSDGTLKADVDGAGMKLDDLATLLETAPELKGYNLTVKSLDGSKIVAAAGK